MNRARVLLVDDEVEFVETLGERLEARDFFVITAGDGTAALAAIAEHNFDVVVLDVMMPGLSGIETLRKIKEQEPLVEVIMLTGHATVDTAIEGMKLGAFDFLIKPTETPQLVEKIERACRRKREQEERIREAEIEGIVKRRGW
jgi:DNA-binding NtrC family response regulator